MRAVHAFGRITAALVLAMAGCGTVEATDPDADPGGGDDPDAEAEADASGGGETDAESGANQAPTVANIALSQDPVSLAGETSVTCDASDPDGDQLAYTWQVDEGTIDGEGSSALWSGFEAEGEATVTCTVDDQNGETASDSRSLSVVVAPDARVAHYPFDGTGADVSGNGHDVGSISGPEFVEDRLGNAGSALSFSRADSDRLSLPNEAAFDLTSFTLAMWINRGIEKGHQTLISKDGPELFGNFTLRVRGDDSGITDAGQLEYGHVSGGNEVSLRSGSELGDGLWLHVAVTVDSSRIALYVNGVEQNSLSSPGSPDVNADFVDLGTNAFQEHLSAAIDDVRIYDRALTEDEVNALL